MTCWVTFLLLLISSKRINERNFEKIKVRFVLFLCLHIWWNEVVNGLFLIVHGWTHKTRVSIGSNICVLKNNIRSHCITLNIFSSHIHTSNASSHYHHHPATNIHGSISLTVRFKLERERERGKCATSHHCGPPTEFEGVWPRTCSIREMFHFNLHAN